LAKFTHDRESAAELMQETFVRLIQARPVFPDARAARAWLFRTATNLARSAGRRRALLSFFPFTGEETAADGAFDDHADHVRAALRAIPFEQASALVLHYHAGFQRGEIAALQDVSEEAVKSRLARGRRNFIAAYRRLERGLAR